METIKKLLSDILNIEFVQAVLSNPRKKEGILKVKVRPIEKKGNLFFQLESFTKTQAFHENLDPDFGTRPIAGIYGRIPADAGIYSAYELHCFSEQKRQGNHSEKSVKRQCKTGRIYRIN